eukprot:TRINITY_DN46812_c0_g1_i1.p1 TRINITY_DN46812_c0_g1~~TRINITY_DN46812_c0_g1_i1.p1  ORF type:complete len:209 (+),score=9.89 TRINITY_DN46812_c0_g1_i1:58-627(+)
MANDVESPSPLRGLGSLLFTCLLTVWQAIVLERYSKDFPRSIFNGAHIDSISNSCLDLFKLVNFSLFVCALSLPVDVSIMLFNFVHADLAKSARVLVAIVKCCEAVLAFLRIAVGFGGMFVMLFLVNVDELQGCSDLYRCCWWCFVGIMFLICVVACCVMGVASRRAARERSLRGNHSEICSSGDYGAA